MGTDVLFPVPVLSFVAISAGWGGLLVSGIQRNKINTAFLLKATSMRATLSSRILQSETALTADSQLLGLWASLFLSKAFCDRGAGCGRGLSICVYLRCWAFSSWLLISLCWLARLWAHCLPSVLLRAQTVTQVFPFRLFSPEQGWRLSPSLSYGSSASILTAFTTLTSLPRVSLDPSCVPQPG